MLPLKKSSSFKTMNQKVVILGFLIVVFYAGLQLFNSPEKYLLKKTKHLIRLGSQVDTKISLSSASKVSEINKYIHHNLQLKVEYEGRIYQASSLNEFRSLLLLYFKAGITQKLEYENLKVKLKDKKTGELSFSVTFHNTNRVESCEVLLNWMKEEKWFIKTINIENCKKI